MFIADGDHASVVLDGAGALEQTSHQCHPGPLRAEHVGEDLLGKRKALCAHAIARHQQPAGETLFDAVEPIACGQLQTLDE